MVALSALRDAPAFRPAGYDGAQPSPALARSLQTPADSRRVQEARGGATGALDRAPDRRFATIPAPGDTSLSDAVVAQISDMARSFFAQAFQQGASAASFDLKLDLRQMGLSIDSQGSRSYEGHSLTIDLHASAERGSVTTDNGQVDFSKLDLSFSIQELWVQGQDAGSLRPVGPGADPRTSGRPADGRAADQGSTGADRSSGASPAASESGGSTSGANPARALLDGLKSLADFLDQATQQLGQGADAFGSGDLAQLGDDRRRALDGLLATIGQSLEQMHARRAAAQAGLPAPEAGQPPASATGLVGFTQSIQVQIASLSFSRAAAVSATPSVDASPTDTAYLPAGTT